MGVTWDDDEVVVILAKWRCASLTEAGWSHLSSSMRLLFKEIMKNVAQCQDLAMSKHKGTMTSGSSVCVISNSFMYLFLALRTADIQ